MKVLIADKTDSICEKTLKNRGLEAVYKPGLTIEELKREISSCDAVIVRSATKITAEVIEVAVKLKAVARAGSGVDTIDVAACSAKKIVVMNTPFGNTISTAEHAIAMMMALAAQRDWPIVLVPGGVMLATEGHEDTGKVQTIGARYAAGEITLEKAAEEGCHSCASPGGGASFSAQQRLRKSSVRPWG